MYLVVFFCYEVLASYPKKKKKIILYVKKWILDSILQSWSEALSSLMNPAHRCFAGADKLSTVLRPTSGYF